MRLYLKIPSQNSPHSFSDLDVKCIFHSIWLWCQKNYFLFQYDKNFAYENFSLLMIDFWWNFAIWKFTVKNLSGPIFRSIAKRVWLKPSGLYLVVLKYFNFGNHIFKIKYLYLIMKSLHIKTISFHLMVPKIDIFQDHQI